MKTDLVFWSVYRVCLLSGQIFVLDLKTFKFNRAIKFEQQYEKVVRKQKFSGVFCCCTSASTPCVSASRRRTELKSCDLIPSHPNANCDSLLPLIINNDGRTLSAMSLGRTCREIFA